MLQSWYACRSVHVRTYRAGELCEGIVGQQQVLQVLTAADLLVHHLQVVLRHIQVFELLQCPNHLQKNKKQNPHSPDH